jgi:mannose-1-phosphate guanylyltransferase
VDSVNTNVDNALKLMSDNLPKDKDNKPVVITKENYYLFTDEKLKDLKLNRDARDIISRERNTLDGILRKETP